MYQQRPCILDDYQSIIEDPESYAYPNLEEHMSEFIADIKEDLESDINYSIEGDFFKTTIEK